MLKKYINHFSSLFGIDYNIYDISLKNFSDFDMTFCSKCPKKCDYQRTHLYGCYESARWDNKYIYYCPMDFVFIAFPVHDEYNILTTGVIAGPILMGDLSDFDETYGITNMAVPKVNHLAEISSAVFAKLTTEEKQKNTTDFLNTVYQELELISQGRDYPLEIEKKLQTAIINGDRTNAREYLNRLLGDIFFRSNGDFAVIKTRALELLVLLSRSAIEGGASTEQIFSLNNNYINEINQFQTIEQLSLWLSNIINRFASYIFDFSDIKHADVLHKVIGYIKANYMNKITLDDIADYVYMSRTYISKIFNQEMNLSISAYINKVRIEKSKRLLTQTTKPISEVAVLVGFEDQSYFGKHFKALTGISPKKFREKCSIHSKQ